MKRHVVTVHPSFKCDYCDYSADSKSALSLHHYNDHGLHVADINDEEMKVVIINNDEESVY